MRKKKLALLTLISIIGGVLITGCGNKTEEPEITVNELVTATRYAIEDTQSATFNVSLEAALKVVQGKNAIDVNASAKIDYEQDKTASHTNGNVNLKMILPDNLKEMFEMDNYDETLDINRYTKIVDDTTYVYEYDSEEDKWTKTEDDTYSEEADVIIDNILNSEILNKLTLTKENDGYKITGKIPASEVMNLASESEIDTESLGVSSDMLKDISLDVTLTFDNDKMLKTFEASIENSKPIESEEETVTINKLKINASLDKIGNTAVKIPSDIE